MHQNNLGSSQRFHSPRKYKGVAFFFFEIGLDVPIRTGRTGWCNTGVAGVFWSLWWSHYCPDTSRSTCYVCCVVFLFVYSCLSFATRLFDNIAWLKLKTMIQWFGTLEYNIYNRLNWPSRLRKQPVLAAPKVSSYTLHLDWKGDLSMLFTLEQNENCVHVAKFVQSNQSVKQWMWPLKTEVATSVSREIQFECMEPRRHGSKQMMRQVISLTFFAPLH